jgi:hypothetical protein
MSEAGRKLATRLDRVAQAYEEAGWLRGAVAFVPFGVGSSIDAQITAYSTRLGRERIETLISELASAVDKLGQEKVDQQFLESEEWGDLLRRAFRLAADTRDRDKIRVYAGILASAASSDHLGAIDAEAALSAIADVSPNELVLARAIHKRYLAHGGGPAPAMTWGNPHDWIPGAFVNDLDFHLNHIEQAGLIRRITEGAPVGRPVTFYVPTPTFDRLMKFLAADPPGAPDDDTPRSNT